MKRNAKADDVIGESAAAGIGRGESGEGKREEEEEEEEGKKQRKERGKEGDETERGGGGSSWKLLLFLFTMCAVALCYVGMSMYGSAVVRTIERRFGLTSTQTGIIRSGSDITHVCVVIFVGYFGRKMSKPRIIALSIWLASASGFIMASPYYFFPSSGQQNPSSRAGVYRSSNASDNYTDLRAAKFCAKGSDPVDLARLEITNHSTTGSVAPSNTGCPSTVNATTLTSLTSEVHPAFYVFLAANLIKGFGGSAIFVLGLAYIDENAPLAKSSLYLGALTSTFSIGPIVGMMLSAVCLSLPESLISSSQTTEKSTDQSWIGCWWLGYIVFGGALLLSSIPLWFIPKAIRRAPAAAMADEDRVPVASRTTVGGFAEEIKEFWRVLLHLLRNGLFILNLGQIVCGAYILMGIYTNVVRYIEIHFMERAFVASIIAGLVSACAGAVGGFGGGFMMSRLRLGPLSAVKVMLISSGTFIVGLVVVLFLGCPQPQMAGQTDPTDGRFSVITDCNRDCACATSRMSYNPVCGNDGMTYFSPCIAGCKDDSGNGTFARCECVGLSSNDSTTVVRRGFCIESCNLLIPYAVVLFIISFVASLSRVPATIVSFRIVDDDERSFALGINSFAFNLLGFTPGSILFGSLIDRSCLLWEQTTCGRTGSCLQFDTAKFRYFTYGVAALFETTDFVLVLVLLVLFRRRQQRANSSARGDLAFPNGKKKELGIELNHNMGFTDSMETIITRL